MANKPATPPFQKMVVTLQTNPEGECRADLKTYGYSPLEGAPEQVHDIDAAVMAIKRLAQLVGKLSDEFLRDDPQAAAEWLPRLGLQQVVVTAPLPAVPEGIVPDETSFIGFRPQHGVA